MLTILKFASIFITLLGATDMPIAQHSCCSPITMFASFGADAAFKKAHENPLPFELTEALGTEEHITTKTGKDVKLYKVKGDVVSNTTILVFHEWWGVNDYIKQQCDEIYKSLDGKPTVIAVDLYNGKVATDRTQASALMQAVDSNEAQGVIKAVISSIPENHRIGTVGWCFGGGWSLKASMIAYDRAAACVVYYGMPELESDKLVNLYAPVLGIFASKDQWITPEIVKKFETAMQHAKKSLTVKSYNADHAFANPSNPHHDRNATIDAYNATIAFFKENLIR